MAILARLYSVRFVGAVGIVAVLVGANFLLPRHQNETGPNGTPPLPPALAVSEAPMPQSGAKGANFELPKPDLDKLYLETVSQCSWGQGNCYTDALKTITADFGPASAIEILSKLEHGGEIAVGVDDHQLAHVIGRKTAERFGVNGQAFLICPTSFNYGCQHGFFEYALGRTQSEKTVIETICGAFERDPDYSSKFKFYCYHGVGHGVMMARAYDLDAAIRVCDSLDSRISQDGCWQGVFMENVNAGMRGEARPGVFSETNALAPCDRMSPQYRHECFINHSGWLMRFFKNDVGKATQSCLAAPTGSADACLQSIGLMVTNPVWQAVLTRADKGQSPEELAWQICLEFPASARSQCMIGGVDNILNFDQLMVSRADTFCSLVEASLRDGCYQRIGVGLAAQVTDGEVLRDRCNSLSENAPDLCLAGARVQ